ncbi:hypothetical protein BDU57DRAFT_510497 [Ampelomyces quisqualis]|uniref:Uncharacterized protein n=1 Tax=Ampelomyces quisqualis TaxID=50730 RepID=A0A6A5R0K4_AMPQU|nr:hypothetical protein BDU57DRAFT_510497 [Ampelomyces quisqualis]
MVRAVLVVLGMVVAAIAQYTGPMFDPGNAPFFGPSGIVYPTLSDAVPTTVETPTFIQSRVSSALASGSVTSSATGSVTSSSAASRSAQSSGSQTASTSLSSSAASSASAPASTGAAVANVPRVAAAIAGGVFAGWAIL